MANVDQTSYLVANTDVPADAAPGLDATRAALRELGEANPKTHIIAMPNANVDGGHLEGFVAMTKGTDRISTYLGNCADHCGSISIYEIPHFDKSKIPADVSLETHLLQKLEGMRSLFINHSRRVERNADGSISPSLLALGEHNCMIMLTSAYNPENRLLRTYRLVVRNYHVASADACMRLIATTNPKIAQYIESPAYRACMELSQASCNVLALAVIQELGGIASATEFVENPCGGKKHEGAIPSVVNRYNVVTEIEGKMHVFNHCVDVASAIEGLVLPKSPIEGCNLYRFPSGQSTIGTARPRGVYLPASGGAWPIELPYEVRRDKATPDLMTPSGQVTPDMIDRVKRIVRFDGVPFHHKALPRIYKSINSAPIARILRKLEVGAPESLDAEFCYLSGLQPDSVTLDEIRRWSHAPDTSYYVPIKHHLIADLVSAYMERCSLGQAPPTVTLSDILGKENEYRNALYIQKEHVTLLLSFR